MNDRFKFRWYSKIYNEMCDVNCIEPNNEFVNFQQGKFNDISTRINLGNGVLMQCTGLKDKNGKLIYEGDVVKIKNEIFFIKYEIGSFLIIRNEQSLDAWYEMFTEAWNDDVYPLSQLYVDEYIQEEYIDCIEVIGNIYQDSQALQEIRQIIKEEIICPM